MVGGGQKVCMSGCVSVCEFEALFTAQFQTAVSI